MKRPVNILALVLLPLGLLYILVSHGGLTWSAVEKSIDDLAWWVLIGVLALTGANLALGTVKWLLVLRAFAPDSESHPRFVDGMLTTTLGALLGQLMPVQVGVALTRSLAGRLGVGRSPAFNLGTTAYEQLFDAFVLCLAGVTSLLGLLLSPGPGGWLALILLTGSTGLFATIRLARLLAARANRLSPTSAANRLYGYASKLGEVLARAAEFSPLILAQLMVLSFLRYATILLRAVIVLGALGMAALTVPAIVAFPVVQVMSLLPITPGNLGVIEWTWSGVLVSAGAAMTAAALFAITARIVSVAAQSIVLILLIAFRLFPGASTARADADRPAASKSS